MSASPLPQPPRKLPICKIPLTVFEHLLELCNYTQLRCFLLVLDRTVGLESLGRGRPWARISWDEFAEICQTTSAWCEEAVRSLIRSGFLRERFIDGKASKPEFSISPDLAAEARAAKIRGRCSECKTVGIFPTEFIPMPRSFCTKLAPAVNHVTFLTVAVIARFSHERAWTAAEGLQPKWVTLDRNDIEKKTGLDLRQISSGLQQAVEMGLIERRDRTGRPSTYRTLPENWESIKKRHSREITPPERETTDKAKPREEKQQENPAKDEITPAIESVPPRFGWCQSCGHMVEIETVSVDDPVTPEVMQPEKEKIPRAGPTRETKKAGSFDAAWEMVKKRWNQKMKA